MAILLGLSVGILVLLGILSYNQMRNLIDNKSWVEHTHRAVRVAEQIGKLLIDMETGERGFLITGKDDFLEPYTKARATINAKINEAKKLVEDNPIQVERLIEIENLVSQWFDKAATPEIASRRNITAGSKLEKELQDILVSDVKDKNQNPLKKELASLEYSFEKVNNFHASKLVTAIGKDLVDMETSELGFLITGRAEFLKRFENRQISFQQHIDELTRIVDSAYDRTWVEEHTSNLEVLIESWLEDTVGNEIFQRKQVDIVGKQFSEIEKMVSTTTSQNIIDKVRAELGDLRDVFRLAEEMDKENIVRAISKDIADMEIGQRGFMVTGDDYYLVLFRKGKAAFARHLKSLKLSVRNSYDPTAAKASLQRIRSFEKSWIKNNIEVKIRIRQQMNNAEKMEDVIALIEAGIGKDIVDKIRTIEHDFVGEEMDLLAKREKQSAKSVLVAQNIIVWGTLLSVIIITFLGQLITSGVTNPVSNLLAASNRIKEGDLEVISGIESSDEIGELALSFDAMVLTMKNVANTVQAVAAGDLKTKVVVKSEHDLLAISINDMTERLEETMKKNEIESWLKNGQTELAEKLRGDYDLETLCKNVVSWIADYLRIQVAIIYVADEDHTFRLMGSYAHVQRKDLASQFKPGEGLIGQAVLEKNSILIADVPDNYIRIQSGLGNEVPQNILVVPVIHKNSVIAVLEIGSFSPILDIHISLCELLSESIAVEISSVIERRLMKDLLEQTQRQAEELQNRQEQLKAANENLEEQTQLLKSSQNELEEQSEELKDLNEGLVVKQKLLKQQNDKVEAAKEDVEIKARELALASKYKSEFLANMSHELRTPLNSLLLLSQALANNKKGHLDKSEVEDAKVIYDGGNDLLKLIDDIMDFSKIEAGMLSVTIEDVNIGTVTGSLRKIFDPVAADKNLAFEIDIDDNLPVTIKSDIQRLQQILKNLLANAMKFTDNGTVTLNVMQPGPEVIFRHSNLTANTSIGFAVMDTGVGIPEDKQQVIFETFQQEDGSTSRKYGGTGLGLTISKDLSRLLGGEIQVKSSQNLGSTFTLFIPITLDQDSLDQTKVEISPSVPEKRHVEGNLTSPRENSLGTTDSIPEYIPDDRTNIHQGDKTLLIVDDDKKFAKILYDHGRDNGYKCIVAGDGRSGILLAQEYEPNGILLDVGLPDIDGYEVLDQLKFSLKTRHIPVQVISAHDEKQCKTRLQGAIGYLTKPVNEDQLNSVLNEISRLVETAVKNILIIGDDGDSRHEISGILEDSHTNLKYVGIGKEDCFEIHSNRCDCVIIDLGLPDMRVFDILKNINENGAGDLPPVIVYTGREITDEEHKELYKYSSSIVVKGAGSPERLLDDVSLFLHTVESKLDDKQKEVIRMLHDEDGLLNGRKILLVDDDMRNTYALSKQLIDVGLSVKMAKDGQEAVEIMRKDHSYELVLMDVMMPVMDGYEATRRIRKMPEHKNIPIIALTAKAMTEDRQKSLDAGASEYLTKPIDFGKLLSLLRIWLFKRS